MRITIVGGTGKEGRGLAQRWARAGHHITLGSRDAGRAQSIAEQLGGGITGDSNEAAVANAEVVVLSVPYAAHAGTLKELASRLAGRIVIDLTVPLAPPKVTRVHLPPGRAAALETAAILGASATVVAALHHISSAHLADAEHAIDSDVLVCSDDPQAMAIVLGLVRDLGLRGLDAGPLDNAVALEALTPVLIHLNKKYRSTKAGLRITGIVVA